MTKSLAVVTGANRGIGFEIVRQLAAVGVSVVGTSRDLAAGQAGARKLGVTFVQLDVTQMKSIDALREQVENGFEAIGGAASHEPLRGGLDILVNNAAVSLDGFDSSVARRTLDVNFFGAMHVTDRLLPIMRKNGRVVMVSSGLGSLSAVGTALRERFLDSSLGRSELVDLMEGFVRDVAEGVHTAKGWPTSAYRVSKIGLNALTRILARALHSDGRNILVNAGSPGWVRTAMGGAGAPRSVEEGARTPVRLALLPEGGPSGEFFEDEQVVPW